MSALPLDCRAWTKMRLALGSNSSTRIHRVRFSILAERVFQTTSSEVSVPLKTSVALADSNNWEAGRS